MDVVKKKKRDVVSVGALQNKRRTPDSKACRAPKSLFGLGKAWIPWHMFPVRPFQPLPFTWKCFLQKTRAKLMFWTSFHKFKVKPLLAWAGSRLTSSSRSNATSAGIGSDKARIRRHRPICISSWHGVAVRMRGWFDRGKISAPMEASPAGSSGCVRAAMLQACGCPPSWEWPGPGRSH